MFAYRREQLEEIATDMLRIARELDTSDAAMEISEDQDLSVTVRKGKVKIIEQNRDKVVGMTVVLGKKCDNVSTSGFLPAALRSTVGTVYNIARFIADDDCAGLTEEELLEEHLQDSRLYHPWMIDVGAVVEIAYVTEAAAFVVSLRIRSSDSSDISA